MLLLSLFICRLFNQFSGLPGARLALELSNSNVNEYACDSADIAVDAVQEITKSRLSTST